MKYVYNSILDNFQLPKSAPHLSCLGYRQVVQVIFLLVVVPSMHIRVSLGVPSRKIASPWRPLGPQWCPGGARGTPAGP